jgi:hypothetical protein
MAEAREDIAGATETTGVYKKVSRGGEARRDKTARGGEERREYTSWVRKAEVVWCSGRVPWSSDEAF